MASVPTPTLAGVGGFGQLEGMVTASEIRDEDSLEQWLSGRSKDDAVVVAQRTACRVLPLWGASIGEDWARKRDLTALPVLRANLSSGVGRKYATPEVRSAATAAADAATAAYAAADYIWEQVREDARLIEAGEDPLVARLWSIPEPEWFSLTDSAMRANWRGKDPEHWAFWTRWWDGVLSGRQVDWELQRQVAVIPNDVWERGPDAVAEAIAKLDGSSEPDVELLGSDDDLPQSHEAVMARNARAIRLQLDTLRVFVEDEIERLRGANSLSSREHAALTLRLEMLAKIVEAVTLMREAFEEDAPGGNALVVVGAQLPAVVEAADNAVAGGGAPEVSAAIVSMATTIKYLTDAGTPGNYATGIAFGDMCWGKIKGWWTRK